jgi:hypothetical protein
MVNINLKEIFSIDNQSDLASKLNFNFNQLLSLGVGQTGATGETGAQGPAGPVGPIGPQGNHGSTIYEAGTSTSFETLTIDPEAAIIGDYFISGEKIYTKTSDYSTSGQWRVVTDFVSIATSVLSATTATWQLGVKLDSHSRHLVLINNSGKADRNTVPSTSSSDWATNDPNWSLVDTVYWNSQVLGYNFDPQTVKIYEETEGLNGYNVNITPSRLGSGVGDEAFPYSAIATFYSFFTNAEQEADQFDLETGYRHQLELGSVDDIVESLVSSDSLAQYVVSPTWQNLRIRKFRTVEASAPGGALVHADFNLHSDDYLTRPALNSRFAWRINKKTSATANTGDNILLALSTGLFESYATDGTRINVDGLHLTSDVYKIAFGIDPTNNGSTIKNAIFSSGTSATIDTVVLDKLKMRARNGSTSVVYDHTGVSSTSPLIIKSGAGGNNDITIQSGTSTSDGGHINILATNTAGKRIIIGKSTVGASEGTWTGTSGYAIRILGNRLGSGIPFAYSAGSLPTNWSDDPNVLDEYQEGTFTPNIVYTDTLPTPGQGNSGTSALSANTPTFADKSGTFTKIGNVVTFSLQFSISNWKAMKPAPISASTAAIAYSSVGPVGSFTSLDYGNLYGTSTPSAVRYGAEPYQIRVRGIMDHWPINGASGDLPPKFSVIMKTDQQFVEAVRSNAFTFKYGGTGTGSTLATSMWQPIDPASIYAQFGTWDDGGTTRPHLELLGFRNRNPSLGYFSTYGIPSRVSVYDFLRRRTDASSDKVFITISGTYITSNQTADQATWSQYDPEPIDDGGLPPIE